MRKKNICKFVFLAFLFYATESSAVLWPPCPICPSFDGINDVIETAKALLKKARVVVDDLQYYQDQALNVLKTAKKYMALDFTESPLKKEGSFAPIATAKDIVPAKVVDIADAASVSEGFQKLFLKNDPKLLESFPVDYRSFIKDQYEKKRAEFAYDNMVEVHVSAHQFEDERLVPIKKELDSLSECFVEGREGKSASCSMASESDEELGNWSNNYKLKAMRNSMMRVHEELVAMEAQYQSGNSLKEGVRPVNDDATVSEEYNPNMSFNYEAVSSMAFAQQADGFINKVESSKSTPKVNPNLELVQTEEYKEKPPFEGSEELVNSLAILNGAYELLSLAEEMHNTKQQLPDLRKPFIEYEKMRMLHLEAIKKLAYSEQYVRDYLSDYYGVSNANDIWFGDTCKLQQNHLGMMCPKVTGCKESKEFESYNVWNVACATGVFSVTAYEKKPIDSISGASIREYQLSKAKKVMELENVDTNDPDAAMNKYDKAMGKTEIDMDQDTTTPDADEDADVKDYVKDSDTLSKPSNEAEAEGGTREQNLNRWQIGRQKSIEIGEDMQNGGKKYGYAHKKYPVWTDEKRFYNQYLKEKYRNMSIYLESGVLEEAIFDIANEMNETMTIDEDKLKEKVKSETNKKVNAKTSAYAATLSMDDPNRYAKIEAYRTQIYNQVYEDTYKSVSQEFNEKLQKVKNENRGAIASAAKAFGDKLEQLEKDSSLRVMKKAQDDEMAKLIASARKKIEKIEDQKAKVNEELEDQTNLLDVKKAEYNKLMDQKKSAESSIKMQKQSKDLAQKRETEDPELTYESGMKERSEGIIKEKETELEDIKAKLEIALQGVEELQDNIDFLRKRVVQLDKQIKETREDYIEEAVLKEHMFIQLIKEALAKREALAISFDPSTVTGSSPTLQYALNVGKNMMTIFKEHALEVVATAYVDIMSLGDNLYNPDKFSLIQNIHITMLNNLAAVAFAPSVAKLDDLVISNVSIVSKAPEMFYKIVFKSDCEGEGCRKEDKEYFVSLKGRARDFTVPRRITPKRTPPVREVFHFDYADFGSILTTKGQCPTFFKKMVIPKTIRAEFLDMGEAMPEIWQTILKPDGFVERDVDLEDILNPGSPDETSYLFLEDKGEGGQVSDVGELSVFLKYENGLTFTQPLYSLVCYFDAAEDETSKKKIKEKEYRENEKRMLGRNQISDYLQFVDQERTYQISMNQLKVKVDEGRRSIEEVLAKIDCTYKPKETGYITDKEVKTKIVSAEYIADQETYEAIAKCLDNGKNLFMSEAQGLMDQLSPEIFASYEPDPKYPEYTNLRNRKKKIDNLKEILTLDFNERVLISDNSVKDDIETQIKTKDTDNSVVTKYESKAQEEFEKNKNNMEHPYRARYF